MFRTINECADQANGRTNKLIVAYTALRTTTLGENNILQNKNY